MRGTWAGRPATAFDYRWTTGSGDDSTTHRAAVVALGLPAPLPPLEVGPRGMLRAVWDKLSGGPDVVVADAAFTERFHVIAPDPRFAYDVLTPATTALLLRSEGISWRTCGPWLVGVASGTLTPPLIEHRLGLLCAVADGIPPLVWQRLGVVPGPPPVPPDRPLPG